jgi:ketosteroid isomerase-like protein
MHSDALHEWLTAYGRAWETRDPEAAAALFTEDIAYYEKPYTDPARGREGVRQYWDDAVSDHGAVSFSFEILAISDEQSFVRWLANLNRLSSGKRVMIDGIFILKFAENGLCRELREWWFYEEYEV